MSYRKLFLLIAFAPLGLLLFVGNAQPWDGDDSPWGFMDWGNGSRVRCTFGFDDTTITATPPNGTLLTITISLKDGKTLTCAKIPEPGDPPGSITQSGQAELIQPLRITGVQDKGCSNSGNVSERLFEATCGENKADVTGIIKWVDGPLAGSTYEFGGAGSLNTGACNKFFPRVAGTFDRNVIFINREGFNSRNCPVGEGNHGPTFFRGCSATTLGTEEKPVASSCTDSVHTGGTPANAGLLQLREFTLICRTPFNTSSCPGASGVIQAEIDCTSIDCGNIIQSSLTCGEPDDPFTEPAVDVKSNQGNLVVTCHRCVASAAAELVVAGQSSDGTKFRQDIAGLCTGEPTSR
jgi:hypothetical protein